MRDMAQLNNLVQHSGSEKAGAEANTETRGRGKTATIEAGMELGTLRLPTRAEGCHFRNISGPHRQSPRGSLSSEGSRVIEHGEEHREDVATNRIVWRLQLLLAV